MQKISLIVGPLMLLQPIIIITQCITKNSMLCYLSVLAILTVWLVTFFILFHVIIFYNKMGYDKIVVDKLIITNWLRTIPWGICLILGYFIHLKN